MQNSNSIYEIAKLMKDKNYIQNDISQAITLVKDFFKNKYITSLENEIVAQATNKKNNPSKEIRLLSVLKEFTPNENHSQIDNLINSFNTLSAIFEIQKKINPISLNINENSSKTTVNAMATDPSVKADGVYDIDESCKVSTQTSGSKDLTFYILLIFLALAVSDNKRN